MFHTEISLMFDRETHPNSWESWHETSTLYNHVKENTLYTQSLSFIKVLGFTQNLWCFFFVAVFFYFSNYFFLFWSFFFFFFLYSKLKLRQLCKKTSSFNDKCLIRQEETRNRSRSLVKMNIDNPFCDRDIWADSNIIPLSQHWV